ncbi:phytanoyl-CoA dioxygenase family protein [Micromonospora profundi]|uniref:phytanoyl-CoA dioxygenase family protein n=1 Tax=Micromonospora profundi TaxID=1420889 RepID=UPI0033B0A005
MNEHERYFFDVNGYIVIKGILSPEMVRLLNTALDDNSDRSTTGFSLAAGAATLNGTRRQDFEDFFAWPEPAGDTFRRLVALPAAVRYLLEILGEGFRYDTVRATVMTTGTEGFKLHGGGGSEDTLYYSFVNGKIRNGLVNISYSLTDVEAGDGGFACLPGSHKANLPCPVEVSRLDVGSHYVQNIPVKAGDAILFTEALVHGTLPWKAPNERRTVFARYSPGPLQFRRDPLPKGYETFAPLLTPLQKAILEPPYFGSRPKIARLLEKEVAKEGAVEP